MPEFIAHFKSVQPDLGGSLPGNLIFSIPGKDGGYYLVAAEQTDANTIRFTFTPSQKEMPAVDPVDITLPNATGAGLTNEQITALDNMFKVVSFDTTKDVKSAYSAFKIAFDITGMVEYFVAPTKSVVGEINNLGDDWISFVAIADPHGDANMQNSQAIVNYLLETSKCESAILLGDYSTEYWSEAEYSNWVEPLKVNAEKIYPVIGNHERMGASASDIAVIYTDFLADKANIVGTPESYYYYRDIESHKLRVAFINTSETSQYRMSETQLTWLKTTAETLPDSSWHLMVCAHVNVNDLGGVTRSNSPDAEAIINAISSCNGKIVGYFCGHQHIDDARDIGSFHQVLLLNDKLETKNYYEGYSVTDRKAGTVSEQAVSVISVNTTTCDVVVRRIGAGKTMVYNYAETNNGEDTEKTLTSISAVYSGGSVTAGTVVNDLTGIVVTAHYSDGTSEAVTGYALSGTIDEGENTVTVSYDGMTTTFVVVGVIESDEPIVPGEELIDLTGNKNVLGTYEGASYTINSPTSITTHGTTKNLYTYIIVNFPVTGKKLNYSITVNDCSGIHDPNISCSIYGCKTINAEDDSGYTARYVRGQLPSDKGGTTYSGEIQLNETEYGVIIYLQPEATFELSVTVAE